MDIGSGSGFPSANLSNFHPHPFVIDGVQCNSMEGFLQSLKFKEPEMQKQVCLLVGKAAKFIDLMEEMGIASKKSGMNPREVLMSERVWRDVLKKLENE